MNQKRVEYHKKYYQKNKQKHLDYMKTKVRCDVCEKMIQRCYLPKHKTTGVCKNIAMNNQLAMEKAIEFMKKHGLKETPEVIADVKNLLK